MKKWEYKIHSQKSIMAKNEVERLNEFGQEGWELVGITFHGVFYFKREMK